MPSSSPANYLWNVAVGDYELTIDRKTLTYRLVETKTGTVWADGLSIGSIEFEDRNTGERQTVDFAQTKLVSLSEKAGAQGKRILFGLDWNGVPIDITFTATQREIQLIVEASRDTRPHRVQDITLLPGLATAPDDGIAHLVLPYQEGALFFPSDVRAEGQEFPVWDQENGLTMPFVGAVRPASWKEGSALALITDSAYASFHLARSEGGAAAITPTFERDPERRRLELRITPLPGGDFVAIARTYRDKIVADHSHVTLRRKSREEPLVERLIGAAQVSVKPTHQAPDAVERLHAELGVEQVVWRAYTVEAAHPRPAEGLLAVGVYDKAADPAPIHSETGADMAMTNLAYAALKGTQDSNRWEDMEERTERISSLRSTFPLIDSSGTCDWAALALHTWDVPYDDSYEHLRCHRGIQVPLQAVIYHDAVITPCSILDYEREFFLRAVLNLTVPSFPLPRLYPSETAAHADISYDWRREQVKRICAVLLPLHRLSFAAFLNYHRFLTTDYRVEEARYTNGVRVVINQSETDDYVADDLHLPPLGFFVGHSQMVAHNARRVGNETFSTRAWRITRSRDDKPIAESADVLRQEFPVMEG